MGLFASDAAAPIATVVAEAVADVGELGFHGRACLVEVLGSVESSIDVVDLVGELTDVSGLVADLVGEGFDGPLRI